ncbi:MAG: hypothetical protein HXS54_00860 [Theionarchaea archaeon]|nr:hypothetical protein [Theionarchaea archaeon]
MSEFNDAAKDIMDKFILGNVIIIRGLMMNSKEKLKVLRKFKEDQLIDDVVIPLLEEMEFKNITKTHSQREKGLDLVFCKETEFNDREYTGVQVKAKRIHGSASKSGNATEILNQIFVNPCRKGS